MTVHTRQGKPSCAGQAVQSKESRTGQAGQARLISKVRKGRPGMEDKASSGGHATRIAKHRRFGRPGSATRAGRQDSTDMTGCQVRQGRPIMPGIEGQTSQEVQSGETKQFRPGRQRLAVRAGQSRAKMVVKIHKIQGNSFVQYKIGLRKHAREKNVGYKMQGCSFI